jgi:hypothetical protein
MDGRYPPGVFITLSDCTEKAREPEFNKWSHEIFIPFIQRLDFARNTKRFENVLVDKDTFQGRPKYLTISEIYTDNLKQAHMEINKQHDQLKSQGRGFDAYANMIENIYARIGPEMRTDRTGLPVTGIYMVLNYAVDLAREDEFNDWYNKKHGPEALAYGIWDTCYRYKVVDPKDPPHPVPYVTLYEPSMDPLKARLAWNPAFIRSDNQHDPIWVDLLGVIWTGGFRQIYPSLPKQ